jgi:hypothetical protein
MARHRNEERLSLHDAANLLLEECRTILPGLQALFGFQLIAIFNTGFDEKLSRSDQLVHFTSITLVMLAVVLLMAPAAYHRQTGPMKVDSAFISLASRAALLAMVSLMFGISLDFYLIAKVIVGDIGWALFFAGSLFGLNLIFWFLIPRMRAFQHPAGADEVE